MPVQIFQHISWNLHNEHKHKEEEGDSIDAGSKLEKLTQFHVIRWCPAGGRRSQFHPCLRSFDRRATSASRDTGET